MSTSKPIYVGSVKNLYDSGPNKITFNFSDRYSIFDWGEMPDHIDGKGEALSILAKFFFEFISNPSCWDKWLHNYFLSHSQILLLNELKTSGAHHHYLGASDLIKNGLEVKKVHVPEVEISKGEYSYDFYKSSPTNTLVPLEVIFRHGVPSGSSLVKRDSTVSFGDRFELPYIEFSTKLENKDRYLSIDEAKTMAAMTKVEWTRLNDIVTLYSLRLKDLFAEHGIELWDGKFEFAYDKDRNLMLVDSIGPDELRLVKDELSLSKEFLREFYSKSMWKNELVHMQKESPKNWKELMLEKGCLPVKLDKVYKDSFSNFYKSLANLMTGTNYFDVESFEVVIVKMKECRHMRCE